MLLDLKVALLKRGVRQTRMAVDLGWDPAKMSRIINEINAPTAKDKTAICDYLGVAEQQLFGVSGLTRAGESA